MFLHPVKNLKIPQFEEVSPFAEKISPLILKDSNIYHPSIHVPLLSIISPMRERFNCHVLVLMMYLKKQKILALM